MKHLKHFILAALVTSGLFFADAPSASAQDPARIIHEADAGKIININKGDIIQFSFDKNIPNTTPWVAPIVVWKNVAGNLQETGVNIVYDFTQDPPVATAATFNYYGVKAGQTVLMFYKNSITATKNENGSTKVAFTDSIHPMVNELTFIVNVNEPNKKQDKPALPKPPAKL